MKRVQLHALIILASSALQFVSGFNSGRKSEQNREDSEILVGTLLAHVTDTFDGCREKHSLCITTYKKNPISSRKIFDKLSTFLGALKGSEVKFIKRRTNCDDHVVKCFQKDTHTVTCFSGGKFYQFQGSLEFGEHTNSQNLRKVAGIKKRSLFPRHSAGGHSFLKERGLNSSKSLLTKELSRSEPACRNLMPYQEVMMEPNSRKWRPQGYYGFVAPQASFLYEKKSNSRRRNSTIKVKSTQMGATIKINESGVSNESLATSLRARSALHISDVLKNRNQRSAILKHLVGKRSQIVSVACRPLYIPTAKPSVNDGRVPQCRIPCGAHNCGPFPTCPCRPPIRSSAPPPSTCPPIPGLAESEATMSPPTRCPAYEFTDEPCPTFECKDGCPYLTTPGCPCPPLSSKLNKRVSLRGNSAEEVGKASQEYQNVIGKGAVSRKPTSKTLEYQGSVRSTDRTSIIDQHTTKALIIASMASTSHVSTEGKTSKGYLSEVLPDAASNLHAKGKPRMDSKNNGSGFASNFGTLGPGIWSSFDFNKLLKSAKSHFKEKEGLNNRNNHNDV